MTYRRIGSLVRTSLRDVYTRSAAAAAVAIEAARVGLGEVRLAETSPYVVYLVAGAPGPRVDTLGAFATVMLETSAHVTALDTYPTWRRHALWTGATPVNCTGCMPDGAPGSAGVFVALTTTTTPPATTVDQRNDGSALPARRPSLGAWAPLLLVAETACYRAGVYLSWKTNSVSGDRRDEYLSLLAGSAATPAGRALGEILDRLESLSEIIDPDTGAPRPRG